MLFWPSAPQTTESLTILPALGLLLGSSSAPTGGEFLPVARISRVVVGEALEGFGARSYLGIVLGDHADVVVAFPVRRSTSRPLRGGSLRQLSSLRIVASAWPTSSACTRPSSGA